MTVTTPAISAVRQPVSELAENAWAALMARLREPAGPPRQVRLACELVARTSTADWQIAADSRASAEPETDDRLHEGIRR